MHLDPRYGSGNSNNFQMLTKVSAYCMQDHKPPPPKKKNLVYDPVHFITQFSEAKYGIYFPTTNKAVWRIQILEDPNYFA